MDFLPKLRIWILTIFYPILSRIGKVHMPFSRKKITSSHYREMTKLLRPGMGILTTTNGELANLLIPGKWSHIGGYYGNRRVIEAIGKGVSETDLIDFVLTKDEILIIKPKFATKSQMKIAAEWMFWQMGKPYDINFADNNEAFYCSELYVESYVSQGFEIPWEVTKTFGVKNAVPQDFADNPNVWEVVKQFP